MDYQNISLPHSGKSTPERPIGQTSCAKLEATKADIRRYTLIVQGFENMITTLKQSNAQDEHDPTFVEMVKQCTYYEDLLDKAVSEFGTLPYCDTPGCPVHEPLLHHQLNLNLLKGRRRMVSPLLPEKFQKII
ncbi:hypothetical protein TNCV_5111171 [Trichonephila clavipes]|nr:hypothetical protein TNCV_5111171 [Trichonephila clavipes]